jgi:hypothetical protein
VVLDERPTGETQVKLQITYYGKKLSLSSDFAGNPYERLRPDQKIQKLIPASKFKENRPKERRQP